MTDLAPDPRDRADAIAHDQRAAAADHLTVSVAAVGDTLAALLDKPTVQGVDLALAQLSALQASLTRLRLRLVNRAESDR